MLLLLLLQCTHLWMTDCFTSYYTLGNMYAMFREYNHSLLRYDHALQAKPGFEQAIKRRHAVLCQQKLEQKLEAQHRSFQQTLNELQEYQVNMTTT